MKYVIRGAGGLGQAMAQKIIAAKQHSLVAFIDKNDLLTEICGVPVYKPQSLNELNYDELIIAAKEFQTEMVEEALELGVSVAKINQRFINKYVHNRSNWVHELAETFPDETGAVAECGVYRGLFSREINAAFPKKTIYLFDTFQGFDDKDVSLERKKLQHSINSIYHIGDFSNTSVEQVLSVLPYPENAVIKSGYFPDTATGINEQFCFVNLDMDLYQPTLAGLRFFSPLMTDNGVILVHDYFEFHYGDSIKRAIKEFIYAEQLCNRRYRLLPIGDGTSIAVLKC